MENTTPNQVQYYSGFILLIDFMKWLAFHFLSWHRLLESHILLFVKHSLPQSGILPSKSALSLLSQVSTIPCDKCRGWFQWFDCFVSSAKSPLPHAEKPTHMLATPLIEKIMENVTPNQVPILQVSNCFHRAYGVVNVSSPFMGPFTRVTHSSFRETLSATIRDSGV